MLLRELVEESLAEIPEAIRPLPFQLGRQLNWEIMTGETVLGHKILFEMDEETNSFSIKSWDLEGGEKTLALQPGIPHSRDYLKSIILEYLYPEELRV
jgi:hypothetical protein